MKLIKDALIRVLQLVIIVAMAYVMMESFDGSTAFNDERVAVHRQQCEQARIENDFRR